MKLKRVEVHPNASFYILNGGLSAYRRIARIGDEPHRAHIIRQMLEDLRTAAEAGWFYLNPKNPRQVIAYCETYSKPFWFVLAPGDTNGLKHIDKDYVVITVLGHRDRAFKEAIEDHRQNAGDTGAEGSA